MSPHDPGADRTFVQALLSAEPWATERLHQILTALVRALGRRFPMSAEDREDAIAEIERRLHTNSADRLQNFSFRCRLEEWLGVVALNVVRDRQRIDRRRLRRERIAGALNAAVAELPEHEQLIERLSAEADLGFVTEGLEPLTRQILELRFVQGLSWTAISLLTGLSEKAATSRTYRALERMQAALATRDSAYASHPAADERSAA